jgi:hypothetical protein
VTGKRARPGGYPSPAQYRSFAEESAWGDCETDDCPRTARTACPRCGGQFCLRHHTHPGHCDANAAAAEPA